MNHSTIKDKQAFWRRILRGLAVFGFWMLLWQLAAMGVKEEILLVSPLDTAARLTQLAVTSDFWLSIGASLLRIMTGFFLALLVGTLLGAATWRFPIVRALFAPLIGVIKATPVASFVILALVWISTGALPIFTSFLMVVPMVWSNVTEGITNTDQALLEMAKSYQLSLKSRLLHLYIPSVYPYFLSAFRTGVGFAWKAGIAAEVLGTPKYAVGTALYQSKVYLETPDLFAWTIVVIVLSMVLEKALILLIQKSGSRLERQALAG